MKSIFLLFPHQLFEETSPLRQANEIYLLEEDLFFNQKRFHKQKLVLHRASMQYYKNDFEQQNLTVHYVESHTAWFNGHQTLQHR